MNNSYTRLDKNEATVLLVDHQAGLLSPLYATSTRTDSRITFSRLPLPE